MSAFMLAALSLLTAGCGGSGTAACDTAEAVAGSGYDAGRAKALCDKYSAGLLSESNYAEMVDMVGLSFGILFEQRDSVLSCVSGLDRFRQSDMSVQQAWRERFPYAEYLAGILVGADSAAMGHEAFVRWRELDEGMTRKMKALEEKRTAKFGHLR